DSNAVRSDIQAHQPLDRHHSAFTSILPEPGNVLSNSAGLTVSSMTSTPSIVPIACRASGWDLPLATCLIWSIRSGLICAAASTVTATFLHPQPAALLTALAQAHGST